MLRSPTSRLAARALLAGLAAFSVSVQQSAGLDGAGLRGGLTAAVFAAVEILTPVNRAVGVGRGGGSA